ncbi:hypothetical protein JQC91_16985 [Jannaschia sp. Os4]|uniref:hypothetical protein n=1 Tax=Jannaschia sp. Os4 TaxID=2807617 RepID=UPI00193A437C|nr:hypothetical protein [Jannaschia sp. Os4]MBM2578003.1 hypothetical protein [Jannaschia sp. Os4]
MLDLVLDGPVRVLTPDGQELTPRGAKARAVLALLGCAPGLRLSRAAVQDRLWSDSDAARGGASLRTTLGAIRRGLRDARGALVGGPGWIGLDPEAVRVRLPPVAEGARFCADLDIPDPEFDDWLRERRMGFEAEDGRGAAPPGDGPLVLRADLGAAPHPIAEMLVHEAAQRLADLVDLRVAAGARDAAGTGLRLGAVATGGSATVVQLRATDERSGRMWSHLETIDLDRPGLGVRLGRASHRMALAALEVTGLRGLDAFGRFSPADLDRDEAVLASGRSGLRPAVADALRAQIYHAREIERLAGARVLTEAADLALRAREAEPGNPIVLSSLALVRLRQGEVGAALDLVGEARRRDAGQGIATFAAVAALAHAGRAKEAYRLALAARGGVQSERRPASAALAAASAAVLAGRDGAALEHARRAVAHAPEARAPRRFVAALAFRAGLEAEAAEALAVLARLEPGFAPRRMLEPDYPVAGLRRRDLLQVARADLI